MAHTAPARDLWRVLRTVRDDVRELRGLLDLAQQRISDLETQAALPWLPPGGEPEWPAWEDPEPGEGGMPEPRRLSAVPDN